MTDNVQVDRLEIVIDANFKKLSEQLNGLNRAVHASAKHIEKEFEGINLSGAFEKIWDASKEKILDRGAETIGIFGKGLEKLGPLALVAGAALAVFGTGLEMAEKTGEWATELGHLSEKLGVTAEEVQQFDYVWVQSGVGIDKGREALEHLNEVFGQAQSGLLTAKSAKPFEALGFGKDPAEVQQNLLMFEDVGEFLKALPEKFEHAGSAAERAGIAERLGIAGLVPLLHEGAGGLNELIGKVSEYGYMSNEAVEKAEKLNLELQTAKQRVNEAANSLGADMLPALVALEKGLATVIIGFQRLWDAIAHGKTPIERMQEQLDKADHARSTAAYYRSGGFMLPGGHREDLVARAEAEAREATDKANEINNEVLEEAKKDREDKAAEAAQNRALALLKAPGAEPKAPREKKEPHDAFPDLQRDAAVKDDDAAKALAEAQKALTENVMARAEAEKTAIDVEAQKNIDVAAALAAKIAAEKGLSDAQRQQLLAELQHTAAIAKLTADDRKQLIDREARQKIGDQQLETLNAGREGQLDVLKAEDALADTAEQRRVLALKMLAIEEQIFEDTKRKQIADAIENGADPSALQQELLNQQRTYGLRQQQAVQATQSPGEKYVTDLQKSTGPGLGDTIQTDTVKILENFNTQLTTAIVNAKNLGSVFGDVARQIETDLINLAIEKYLTLPLAQALGLAGGNGGLGALFGGGGAAGSAAASGSLVNDSFSFAASSLIALASGTDFTPGGMTLVGENGPEILNVPKGAQVIPNNLLGNLPIPAGVGGGASIYIDNRGAVMTQDLVDNMNQAVAAAEQRATANGAALGVQAARSLIPAEMARRASLQIR